MAVPTLRQLVGDRPLEGVFDLGFDAAHDRADEFSHSRLDRRRHEGEHDRSPLGRTELDRKADYSSSSFKYLALGRSVNPNDS